MLECLVNIYVLISENFKTSTADPDLGFED